LKKKIYIDYDKLQDNALRQIIRQVLETTVEKGILGNHHFYITFATNHPGVVVPAYLLDLYPDEMTIVLQEEFWDLKVTDKYFSVTLCFDDLNHSLLIPFDSITSFFDPFADYEINLECDLSGVAENKKANITSVDQLADQDSGQGGEPKSNVISLDDFRKR